MKKHSPYVMVLGIAQDGGFPHAGCDKRCCRQAWKNAALKRRVSCIAIIDPKSKQSWLVDATPDFKEQLQKLNRKARVSNLNGILLTHAHIGHYTGLINLGKEVMNTKLMPVFAASRMKKFLSKNLPWQQLIRNNNIKFYDFEVSSSFYLNKKIKITPFQVPHRDELSETLGFKIEGEKNTIVYIPDIDSWGSFETELRNLISECKNILLDGTFYDIKELEHRNITKIPHPPITETIKLLKELPRKEKKKIHFTHMNHTNPAIRIRSPQRVKTESFGFRFAEELMKFEI